ILSEMKDMKKDIAEIKSKVDGIETKVNQVDSKVDRNYDKTVEFYAMQQEHNTEVSDTLVTITGELEMHNNQIAKNTAAIRRYK
ncbi:MAG: hypothetical protein Q4C59_10350, partial [Lachnospiraceae bacterium]|nr:hypothetical protein [Lachnospiraceae bacterium]